MVPVVTGLVADAFVSVYLSKNSELTALNASAAQVYLTSVGTFKKVAEREHAFFYRGAIVAHLPETAIVILV